MAPGRYDRAGWIAFALSGVFFIIAGARSGDPWTVAGSVVWLIGVGLFLGGMGRR